MFSNFGYDYVKVFFRRPLWNYFNVLFLKFLCLSAFLTLFLTFAATRYFGSIPVAKLNKAVEKNYIAQIVAYYENQNPEFFEEEGTPINRQFNRFGDLEPTYDDLLDPGEVEDIIQEIDLRKPQAEPQNNKAGNATQKPAEYDQSLAALLKSPGNTNTEVQSAINDIAARVNPSESRRPSPVAPYNTRRKNYESSIKKLSTTEGNDGDSQVEIAGSEFTDFEVIRGYRNYEDMISTANNNKRSIQHCIDKYYRDNPSIRGNIVVKFDVHPEGYVVDRSIRVISSDIDDPRVTRCVMRTIRRWRNFPKVAYEMGEYSLTQKYIF